MCSSEIILCRISEMNREGICTYSVNKELTLLSLYNLTSLLQHVHSPITSSMILLMHSWDLLMHMNAIGATEEITLVELGVDPQEENQEVQHQEVPRKGEPEANHLPECPDHQPTTFVKGKPRSIISLPTLLMPPKVIRIDA